MTMLANIRAKHDDEDDADKRVAKGFRRALRVSVLDTDGPEPKAFAIDAHAGYAVFMSWLELDGLGWPSMRKFMRILPHLTNLAVLDYLASLARCVVYRLPKAAPGAEADLGHAIKEFGELVLVAADRTKTPEQLTRLRKEGREAIAAICGLIEIESDVAGAADCRPIAVGERR